jgi:hypothetical protein
MSSWGVASAVPDGSFRRLVAESDLGELRRQHPAWLLQHADHLTVGVITPPHHFMSEPVVLAGKVQI